MHFGELGAGVIGFEENGAGSGAGATEFADQSFADLLGVAGGDGYDC